MSRSPLTDAEKARIAELRERRLSSAAIARAVGCSQGSVDWALLAMGVDIHEGKPLPPVPTKPIVHARGSHVVRRFTAQEDERLLALEASGMNPHRIAIALGRRHNSVIGRLRTLARREARLEAQGQTA